MFGHKAQLYEELYRGLGVSTQVVNEHGRVELESEGPFRITDLQRLAASTTPITLDEGARLTGVQTEGGRLFYTEDLRRIEETEAKIREAEGFIGSSDGIEEDITALTQLTAEYDHQCARYDDIATKLSSRARTIKNLLSVSPAGFRRNLPYAAVLGVYIRRYRRLSLMAQDPSAVLSMSEFRLALTESLDYLQLCNIGVLISWEGNEDIRADRALMAYEFFEHQIESSMTRIRGLRVKVSSREGAFALAMTLTGADRVPDTGWKAEEIAGLGGRVEPADAGSADQTMIVLSYDREDR